VTSSGPAITVSGLAPGASSTITVTATGSGLAPASATTSGDALLAGVPPVLSAPTRLLDGYSIDISNFSASNSYAVSASAGSAALTGSTVTVIGLAPGGSATLTVTATRPGYTDATSSRTGGALAAGVVPTFTVPVSTATASP